MVRQPPNRIPLFSTALRRHPVYGKKLQYKTYKRSQILRSQLEPIEHFGIVVEGLLKAEEYSAQGDELCCCYFENDDVFPGLLYYTGNQMYAYTLVAVKKTTVAWISVYDMEDLLAKDHDMVYTFMLYMARRGLKNQLLLSCVERQTIRERIAYWLTTMSQFSKDARIPLPQSQAIWANTLHVSRSSLNQELKHMEKEGMFCIEGHELVMLDKKRVEAIAKSVS